KVGNVIVTRHKGAVFAGTVRELVQMARPTEVRVETVDNGAVTAMADAFALSIHAEKGSMTITTHDGQALAARLLTEGYGSVRSVVVRQPTVSEALLDLI
ncbi:MAG: hypothetical protein ABUL72_05035, partial [Armatimonadota bacterium]